MSARGLAPPAAMVVVIVVAGGLLLWLRGPDALALFAIEDAVFTLDQGLAGARYSEDWQVVVPASDAGGAGRAERRVPVRGGQEYVVSLQLGAPGGRLQMESSEGRRSELRVAPTADPRRLLFVTGEGAEHLDLRLINESPDAELPVRHLVVREVHWQHRVWSGALILLFAGSALLLARRLGGRGAYLAVLLGALTLSVYRQLDLPAHVSFGSDNLFYVPAALSLLEEGDLELSEYRWVAGFDRPGYRLVYRSEGFYNRFPAGVSVVIAPVVLLGSYAYRSVPDLATRAAEIADLTADVFAALSVVLLFLVARRLADSTAMALLLAAVMAFASPHLPTHAGGLWSHNISLFLVLLSVWLLLRGGRVAVPGAGLALGFALVSRPTALVVAAFLGVFALRHRRSQVLAFAGALAVPPLAQVAWSLATFGSTTPPYAAGNIRHMELANVPDAFAGLLISPSRGLFVFCPILLLSLVGAWEVLRNRDRHHPLFRYLPGACGAYVFAIAFFDKWWGGASYGPRLLAEIVPLLVLLLVPAAHFIRQRGRWPRRVLAALVVAALAFGAFTAWRGATSQAVHDWNGSPRRVDANRWRLWDWSDPQFLRGWLRPAAGSRAAATPSLFDIHSSK